jgi:hypothetical protein
LPDGIFQSKKPDLGKFLGSFTNGYVGIAYGHVVYFTAIVYILWPFGNFFPFWYIAPV